MCIYKCETKRKKEESKEKKKRFINCGWHMGHPQLKSKWPKQGQHLLKGRDFPLRCEHKEGAGGVRH